MAKRIRQTAGYGNIPLRLAESITAQANRAFEDGTMREAVTPVTAELLTYWFDYAQCDVRDINFHEGQRQAILNVIYLHEVLRVESVLDIYQFVDADLLTEFDFSDFAKDKYNIAKYAIKMATGTGKTWVMHAIMIWQILNALAEDGEEKSGRFTKNFLLVAPGLIVYERLLDAYKGKETSVGRRDFATSDLMKFQELFIPQAYRDKIFAFVQNNVVEKDDIGRKITGNGLIAITNWHLFIDYSDEAIDETASALNAPDAIVNALLPAKPGISSGNALDALDRKYLQGSEIEYLADLEDLMVINDEAHHIHELKKGGEVKEVEWQAGLNKIAERKGKRFFQIDFSATPYDESGSENRRVKHYFPHIVVDFDIRKAISKGLVKTVVIDKRAEITDTELDYRVVRDENNRILDLSDGQRLMLRAGLKKLDMLERGFSAIDTSKHPKMLIVCEDTNVSPLVENFLIGEGLNSADICRIDSNAKGELKGEWQEVKQKLFNIDSYSQPKVIISVMMLREGFDVNNICVIVPLRASTSQILLEQTLGRGLRLMWRGKGYEEIKRENRELVMVKKQAPNSYIDILSIIEHPRFLDFYDDLIKDGMVGAVVEEMTQKGVVGDLIKVGLKPDYEQYDLCWINIIHDAVEELKPLSIEIEKLDPLTSYSLQTLQSIFAQDGEVFISEELTGKTQFGKYKVNANLFYAENYIQYLQKMLDNVMSRMERVNNRTKSLPRTQFGGAKIIGALDKYIRERLFGQPFDPMLNNNWKILLAHSAVATRHIIEQLTKVLHYAQQEIDIKDAIVEHLYFSDVAELKMREKYSLELQKTIYQRTGYPSNKGTLEREFLEFLDRDAKVERFIKIDDSQHPFARISYIRTDGLLSSYHPDFMVATSKYIYVVETKGEDKVDDPNVMRKQNAMVDWCEKINSLPLDERMSREWIYVLLSEGVFYSYAKSGADIDDICSIARSHKIKETLFD